MKNSLTDSDIEIAHPFGDTVDVRTNLNFVNHSCGFLAKEIIPSNTFGEQDLDQHRDQSLEEEEERMNIQELLV